jgi:hypothetical protein
MSASVKWNRPLLALHRNHVGVRHQQQRALLPLALDPRHQVGAGRLKRESLHRCAFGFQDLLQVVVRGGLVTRRAAGINLHQRTVMLQNLAFLFLPVDCRDLARAEEATRMKGRRMQVLSYTANVGWPLEHQVNLSKTWAGGLNNRLSGSILQTL